MAFYLLLKPASGLCNMRCKYCFYVDEMENREKDSYGMMTEETLEAVISKGMDYAADEITFAYQGGEPTLRGLDFFRKSIDLQKKYNKKKLKINHALQTNGYHITKEWCEFFRENNFLVGLSIDGTLKTHDRNRISESGDGTYLKCLETAGLFQQHQVEFNILTVVNKQTAPKIRRIYQEYEKRGFHYQQYIACLDPLYEAGGSYDYSLTPGLYGTFLSELFELWYEDYLHGRNPYIRTFENYVGILMGYPPESCEQNGICSIQNVIEADGSVYPCDFYMLDEYCLGNLNRDSFPQIARRREEIKFIEQSMNHTKDCQSCQYFRLCRGGCRRHRMWAETGEEGSNYFCSAYKMFFDKHFDQLMDIAKRCSRYAGGIPAAQMRKDNAHR